MSLESLLAGMPEAVPMGAEQERALTKRAQAGSSAAASRLVSANLRLVVYLVRRLNRPPWIQLDDLVQEGVLGLYHAIRKYRPERGAFRAYAGLWILSYARKCISRSMAHAPVSPDDVPELYHEHHAEAVALAAEPAAVATSTVAAAADELTTREATVWTASLAGDRQADIGRGMGCTKQRVQQIQRAARAKIAASVRRDRRARSLFG